MRNVLGMLKGKTKLDTAERISIFLIFCGVCLLSFGIGLNIFSTTGMPTILAMMGAFVSFVATVVLIFIWLLKDILGD